MKMTLDLPEDLLREIKILAITEGKTFKALVAELFLCGLALTEEQEGASATKQPKIKARKRP